jgi:hypothetical protein
MILYELFPKGKKFYFKGWLIGEACYTEFIEKATVYTQEECDNVYMLLNKQYPDRVFIQKNLNLTIL